MQSQTHTMQAEVDQLTRVYYGHCATPLGVARLISLEPPIELSAANPRRAMLDMGMRQGRLASATMLCKFSTES